MENSKNQSWFTKYGFHIILAALIPSWFTYCGATKISKANFIKSIVPDLLSSDIKKQSLAIYSVKIGIGKNEADDVEKIIGSDYGIKIKQAIDKGDTKGAELFLMEAHQVSFGTYDKAINEIKNFTPTNEQGKQSKSTLFEQLKSLDLGGFDGK